MSITVMSITFMVINSYVHDIDATDLFYTRDWRDVGTVQRYTYRLQLHKKFQQQHQHSQNSSSSQHQ